MKDETETQQATSEIINSNIMVRQCFNINKELHNTRLRIEKIRRLSFFVFERPGEKHSEY
mgnify:CR=1 FL=1